MDLSSGSPASLPLLRRVRFVKEADVKLSEFTLPSSDFLSLAFRGNFYCSRAARTFDEFFVEISSFEKEAWLLRENLHVEHIGMLVHL